MVGITPEPNKCLTVVHSLEIIRSKDKIRGKNIFENAQSMGNKSSPLWLSRTSMNQRMMHINFRI